MVKEGNSGSCEVEKQQFLGETIFFRFTKIGCVAMVYDNTYG